MGCVRLCMCANARHPSLPGSRLVAGTAVVSGQGKGSVDGSGVLARVRVLEPQDRSVAVPCARHRARGGEGQRQLRGAEAARRVLAQERLKAGWERGSYGWL
jgi:hypothetical protein